MMYGSQQVTIQVYNNSIGHRSEQNPIGHRRKKHAELSVQDTDWATMNQELKTIRHKHECLIHIQFRESLSGPSLHVIIYCEIHATEDSEICKLQSESFP